MTPSAGRKAFSLRMTGGVGCTSPKLGDYPAKSCWGAAMDVGRWLRSLGLDKYEAAFRENGIDAQVLRHVTAEDLREIGVATVGDRRKLLAAITELAASSPSTELSPFPSPAARPKTSEVSAERR